MKPLALLALVLLAGCQAGPAPAGPAELRTGPPPWDAPRDAVAYADAAGLERLPLDFSSPAPYTVNLVVTIDGDAVVIPANIGIDLVRAEQASMHTHAEDGVVNVEARTRNERPTVQQFFTLWGVRYDAKCLADACGGVTVLVNGEAAPWDTKLQRGALVQVAATHS